MFILVSESRHFGHAPTIFKLETQSVADLTSQSVLSSPRRGCERRLRKALIFLLTAMLNIHWCTTVHHIPNGLVAMISACHSHRQSAGDQGSIPC